MRVRNQNATSNNKGRAIKQIFVLDLVRLNILGMILTSYFIQFVFIEEQELLYITLG